MKFVVTCLDDDFKTRVLASKSKVFTSMRDAIIYGGTVAAERVATTVHVHQDAHHAAEYVFDQIVEKNPELLADGEPDHVKDATRYEICGDEIVVVFLPCNEVAAAFYKGDFIEYSNRLDHLVMEA